MLRLVKVIHWGTFIGFLSGAGLATFYNEPLGIWLRVAVICAGLQLSMALVTLVVYVITGKFFLFPWNLPKEEIHDE